ncbi:MAG: hypothetical protein V7K88_17360 [Nostoc sp.]|uniref:hypothetical protein n=1 Tax=Nostoc sp. TaxID=1180 RepID=UPI002FFB2117
MFPVISDNLQKSDRTLLFQARERRSLPINFCKKERSPIFSYPVIAFYQIYSI